MFVLGWVSDCDGKPAATFGQDFLTRFFLAGVLLHPVATVPCPAGALMTGRCCLVLTGEEDLVW